MTEPMYGSTNLTSREWQIAKLLTDGLKNVEIAERVGAASEHVIKNDVRKIYDKTGTWNRVELALWYMQVGAEQERRFNDRRKAESEVQGDRRAVMDRRLLPFRNSRTSATKKITEYRDE